MWESEHIRMRQLSIERAARAAALRSAGAVNAKGSDVAVLAELELEGAHLALLSLDHPGPRENLFYQDYIFWVDLCLTPRRPTARASYSDRWCDYRFAEMGPLIAFPPGQRLHLKSAGGRHTSLVCQLKAESVYRWLPEGFEWTDRHFEALLHIANDTIQALLLRLVQEIRQPRVGRRALCNSIVIELGVELARHLIGMNEPVEKGGLASWRMRTIEARVAQIGPPPSLAELAHLCNLSVRQLTRGFQISRGCSIGDFLAQSRIESAKRMLSEGESVKEVASVLGFSSASNFTVNFRRTTGFTPTEFRTCILRTTRDDASFVAEADLRN